jgi:hypothetical protein
VLNPAPQPAPDGTVPPPNSSIQTSKLYFNDGLVFFPANSQTSPYGGPVYEYTFANVSDTSSRIWNSVDFQELINETLQAHKQAVIGYFNSPGALPVYTSPPWQAIGCFSLPNADCAGLPASTQYLDSAAARVDQPPLFPCATSPGSLPPNVTSDEVAFPSVECNLAFLESNDLNLFNTFGRVGYNLTIQAVVAAANPGLVNSVKLSGYIYDIYQWNPAVAQFDSDFANLQSGFGTLGAGGQVYKTIVRLDTDALILGSGQYYQYAFH